MILPQAAHRRPGLRVQARPSGPSPALPRMDVAAFVGYATRGPLDVPVPVEDVERFTALFGPDPELAWDEHRGQVVHAVLGGAVRSFFRNGGRRCVVVRVAGPGAEASRVQLPGVLAVTSTGASPAVLRAGSEGSWADRLRVAVETSVSHVVVRTPSLRSGVLEVLTALPTPVGAGDLLRIPFPDRPDGWTLVATVGSRTDGRVATPRGPGGRVTRLELDHQRWTRSVVLAAGTRMGVEVWHGSRPSTPVPAVAVVAGDRSRLRLPVAVDAAPPPGRVLRLVDVPAGLAPEGDELWAVVQDRVPGPDGARDRTLLGVVVLHVRGAVPATLAGLTGRRSGARVDLVLRTDDGERAGALPLGWGPRHARYLGALPDDASLLGLGRTRSAGAGPDVVDRSALHEDVAVLRCPLAGPERSVPASSAPAYLPLEAPGGVPTWVTCERSGASAQRRDGLTAHTWSTFVDARLAEVGTADLLTTAAALRYGGGGHESLDLRGVHALLHVDEVSMIAVPDAALLGWDPPAPVPVPGGDTAPPPEDGDPVVGGFDDCASTVLAVPDLTVTGEPAQPGLAWTTLPAAAEVVVEQSTTPDFDPAVPLYRGSRSELTLGRPEGPRWFRARYVLRGAPGPWAVVGPLGVRLRPAAVLRRPGDDRDAVAVAVHRALVRTCAARGDAIALLSLPLHDRGPEALTHLARLRAQAGDLRSPVPGLGAGEDVALSHAAAFHPWLVVAAPGRPQDLRRVPPDGAAAGVLARRTSERGAWASSAGVPLRDALGVDPELEAPTRAELAAAGVAVVERTHLGVVALSADTLSDDVELRPVAVRRLLHLLRRLAAREGQQYAFEPNGEALQGAAQRGFEGVLTDLFAAGALAGRRPEQAFRVVVAAPAGRDGAQLVVELRVAPSLPLRFLTVRLARAADGRLQVEPAA